MTDPIADMLTRIKNAYLARKDEVAVPHSKLKQSLADVLVEGKFVESYSTDEVKPQAMMHLKLRYADKLPAMTDVRRVSKPGRRLYAQAGKISKTLGGYGVTIVSTSRGVMSDTQARKQHLGGEVLCQVW
jgi:small subunit ribosomal protein S8